MKLSFKPKEIDDHVLKLIVGFIALSLANLTAFLSHDIIGSISASYYEGDWARDFFIGFLFAISSFMFAYNGDSPAEMILSKIAALAGLGVALFPCRCGEAPNIVTYVHFTSAAIMFVVLACLCCIFYRRAQAKGHPQAKWRSYIYATCAATIFLVIAVLGIDNFTGAHLGSKLPRLTFYGEWAGLVAFGISWLVASRAIPFITKREERVSLLPIAAS
jgi:Protein of unknown function (DUF998)